MPQKSKGPAGGGTRGEAELLSSSEHIEHNTKPADFATARAALIPIEPRALRQNGQPIQTVSARDLHTALAVAKDFSGWVKAQLRRAMLLEGRDYSVVKVFAHSGEKSAGRPRREIFLTVDAAKHMAMLAGTARGREVREYFLQCEARAIQVPSERWAIPQTLAEALRLAAELADQNTTLASTLADQLPKVQALERLTQADGTLCISDAAKALGVRPSALFAWLEARLWIFRRGGAWRGFERRVDSGYIVHRITTRQLEDGSERVFTQPRITPKGLATIASDLASTAADHAISECASLLAQASEATS